MAILSQKALEKKRVLNGLRATVGFHFTDNFDLIWCGSCGRFHKGVEQADGGLRNCCPKMADGEKLAIVLFEFTPPSIVRAVIERRFDALSQAWLSHVIGILDQMIAEQEAVQ